MVCFSPEGDSEFYSEEVEQEFKPKYWFIWKVKKTVMEVDEGGRRRKVVYIDAL